MRGAATRVRSGADAPADARTSGAAPGMAGTRASGRWMRAGAPARAASRWRRSALLWAREGRSRSVRAQRRAFERTSRADAERGPGAPPDGARAGAPTGPHAPRARHGPIGRGGGCVERRRREATRPARRSRRTRGRRPPDSAGADIGTRPGASEHACAGRAELAGRRAGACGRPTRSARRMRRRRPGGGSSARASFRSRARAADRRAVRLRGAAEGLCCRRPGDCRSQSHRIGRPPSERAASGVRRRGPPLRVLAQPGPRPPREAPAAGGPPAEASMKIGVLGSGVVGQVLASGFLARGHEVMRGSGEPAKLAAWKAGAGPKAQVGHLRRGGAVRRGGRPRGEGQRGGRGGGRLRGHPRRQARRRHDEPHRRRAPGERRAALLHRAERVAARAPAGAGAGGEVREGLLLRRERAHGRSAAPGREADHVHLRERRRREAASSPPSSTTSAGRSRTSAPPRRRAPSSRSACCGASRGSCGTSGRTRSSCCGGEASPLSARGGPLAETAPRGRPAPPLRRGVLGAPGRTGPRAEDGRSGMRGAATRVRSGAARLRTLGQAAPRPGWPVRARRAVGAGGRACARGFAVAPGGLAVGARGASRSRTCEGPAAPDRTSRADAERGPGAPPDGARAGAPPETHALRARHGLIGRGGGCLSAGAAKRRAGASSAGAPTRRAAPRADR